VSETQILKCVTLYVTFSAIFNKRSILDLNIFYENTGA
jgi:hypothetical protein